MLKYYSLAPSMTSRTGYKSSFVRNLIDDNVNHTQDNISFQTILLQNIFRLLIIAILGI
jgi:hypothetical protein